MIEIRTFEILDPSRGLYRLTLICFLAQVVSTCWAVDATRSRQRISVASLYCQVFDGKMSSIWWKKHVLEIYNFPFFHQIPKLLNKPVTSQWVWWGNSWKKNQELVNCEVMNSYGFYGDWTRIFMGEIVSRSSSETPWRPGKLSLGQLLMPQVCHDDISTNCVAKNIIWTYLNNSWHWKIYGEIVYQFIIVHTIYPFLP